MTRALWRGERAVLVRPRMEDEDEFLRAVERSTTLHRPWVAPPSDPDAYRAYVRRTRRRDQFGFLVRAAADGSLAGVININNVVFGAFLSGFLGYYAFQPHPKGLMTEALTGVVERAFGTLGLHRLEANIQPDNLPSIRMVERCGFRREGFSPQYLMVAEKWRDHERWAITSS